MRLFLANYFYASDKDIGINDVYRFIKLDTDENLVSDYRKYGPADHSEQDDEAISVASYHDSLRYHLGRSGNLFLKSHAPLHLVDNNPYFPIDLTACFIYIVRHPFDTLVSALNFNFGSSFFKDYDELEQATQSEANQRQIFEFMTNEHERLSGNHPGKFLGSWQNHVNSYRNAPYGRVKLVKYEDMLSNPMKTFGDVVTHITGSHDTKRVKKAVEACQFKKLKTTEQQDGFQERSLTNDLPFFRHGTSGQGQEIISAALKNDIRDAFEKEMTALGYE